MKIKAAKKIILDLLDAGHDNALVPLYRDGLDVDMVFSRKRGCENKAMEVAEAETRTDAAIKAAWKALTGEDFPDGADTVEFVNNVKALDT